MKKQIILGATTAAFIAAMSAGSAFALSTSDLIGEQGRDAQPTRTIQLDSKSPWVNVNYGEVVRIEKSGQSFVWDFDGLASNIKLSQIAPQGFAAEAVTVYVNQADNPLIGVPASE